MDSMQVVVVVSVTMATVVVAAVSLVQLPLKFGLYHCVSFRFVSFRFSLSENLNFRR